MRAFAFESDGRRSRAPCFVADLAQRFAVDGVSELGAESLDVELIDAAPTSSSGVKATAMVPCLICGFCISVSTIVIISAMPDFVIRAEQSGAVGGDDVVADHRFEHRILCDGDHLRRIFRQHDVAALVVLVNDRIDVCAGNGRRCVHVRDESDHRSL